MNKSSNLTNKERQALKRLEKQKNQEKNLRKKTLKQIIPWVLTLLAIIAVTIYFKTPTSSQPLPLTNQIVSSDHTKGNPKATVILIEYSDFQCSACKSYYSILKQLNQEFSDQIQFVYRHFPLRQTHLYAQLAAQAAEAAGKQNKFWEMHDLLFENQKEWSEEKNAKKTFIKYAELLELDLDKFKNDLNSKEVKNKIQVDYQSGTKSGVNSTPSLFLNNKKLSNPKNYDNLKNIIQSSIN